MTGSSRIKDLVDIALIATTQQISGPALRAAVLAGTAHRNLSLPDVFAVPDVAVWRRGYPQSAPDAPGPTPTFDEALSLACALLDPGPERTGERQLGLGGGQLDTSHGIAANPDYGYGRAENRVCLQRVIRALPGR